MDTVWLFAGLYVGAAVVTLAVAGWVLRHRSRPGATVFVALLTVVALWSAINAVSITREPLSTKIFWQRIAYVLAAYVPALWLLFTIRYTGRFAAYWRPIAAIVGAEATIVAALVVTNDSHWLFWLTYEYRIEPFPVLQPVPGPFFVLHTLFTYLLVVVGALLLLQVVVYARDAHRTQPAMLIVAVLIPITLNAGSSLGWLPITGLDYTPIGIGIASVITGLALYRHRLFDVYPVAGETVMQSIRDAVVVVTDTDLIADYNPAGEQLLASDEPLGVHVSEALQIDLDPSAYADPPTTTELTVTVDGRERHLLLDASPLDGHHQRDGTVLILRDVTEQRRQQRELAIQAEHMERFASSVSHDLRNPLNVAQAGVAMLPDDHEGTELVAESHDRMQHIIEDALDFARSGRRITDDEMGPVSLEHVGRDAWTAVDTEQATLEVSAPVTIVADDRRLRRLLENLYRNAVEHGPADVTVRLGTLPDDDGFVVEDDGPGIPEDEREDVLEHGYTTREDGTGFGLAIVAAISQAHDWSLDVTESETGGARFAFTGCRIVADQQPKPS